MADVLSIVAFLIAIIGLFASYDKLVAKCIYHVYSPDIEVTLSFPSEPESRIKARIWRQMKSEEDEYRINPYKLVEYEQDHRIKFIITLNNNTSKRIKHQLTAFAGFELESSDELNREAPDSNGTFQNQYEISPFGNYKKRYSSQEVVLPSNGGTYKHSFIHDMDTSITEHLVLDFLTEINSVTSIDASEFKVPILNIPLPSNIGEIEFDAIEQKYTIDENEIPPKGFLID